MALPQTVFQKVCQFYNFSAYYEAIYCFVSFQPSVQKLGFCSAFFPAFFPTYHDHGLATKNRVVPSRTPTAICRLGGRAASRLLGVLAVPFRVPVVVVRGMTAVEALLLTSELHHHVSKI